MLGAIPNEWVRYDDENGWVMVSLEREWHVRCSERVLSALRSYRWNVSTLFSRRLNHKQDAVASFPVHSHFGLGSNQQIPRKEIDLSVAQNNGLAVRCRLYIFTLKNSKTIVSTMFYNIYWKSFHSCLSGWFWLHFAWFRAPFCHLRSATQRRQKTFSTQMRYETRFMRLFANNFNEQSNIQRYWMEDSEAFRAGKIHWKYSQRISIHHNFIAVNAWLAFYAFKFRGASAIDVCS